MIAEVARSARNRLQEVLGAQLWHCPWRLPDPGPHAHSSCARGVLAVPTWLEASTDVRLSRRGTLPLARSPDPVSFSAGVCRPGQLTDSPQRTRIGLVDRLDRGRYRLQLA